jgi:amidohydrolase
MTSALATSPGGDATLTRQVDVGLARRENQWWQLALDLHAHPELGLHENYASGQISSALAAAGFTVARGVGGLPTALRADYGTGDLTLAFTAEYDALPGLGHACGHNLIAALAAGAGAALAVAADALGIRVCVIGCPGEENAGGKIYLAEAGVFDDVHAAAQIHPANRDELCPATLANDTLSVRYRGQAAHASSFPERGRNAYDAVVIANVAIGLLRQQLPGSARVHALTGPSGPAVNIIPDDTRMTVKIRAADVGAVAGISARVRACLEAGALASGCDATVTAALPRFAEIRYDRVLARLFAAACGRFAGHDVSYLGAAAGAAGDPAPPATYYTPASGRAASTDVGNLSWVVPTIQPMLALETSGGNHEAGFADAAAGPSARALLRDGMRALVYTMIAAAREHRGYFLDEGRPERRRQRREQAVRSGVLGLDVPLINPTEEATQT